MKAEMSGKERILAALKCEEVDRTPVVPLVVAYSLGQFPENAPHYCVDVMREAGCDIWTQSIADKSGLWLPLPDSGIRCFTKYVDGDQVNGYETPVGSIYERIRSGAHSSINPHVKHMLETVDDLKTYLYVLQHSYFYMADMSDYYEYQKKKIGEDGVCTETGITMTPFKDFIESLAGVENTYYLLDDDEELVEEVFDLMHEHNKEKIRRMAEESSAEVFIHSENTSWTTDSPKHYEKYCKKQLDEYADIIHAYGKIHEVHMCGKLKLLADQIKEGKFDAIGDIAPAPTGDTQLWEAAELYPGKAVKGGIECNIFSDKDPQKCYEKSMEILEKTEGRRGILLGSGDSVPGGTTIEHFRMMRRAVDDFYGKRA